MLSRIAYALIGLLTLALATAPARAAEIVANGSFESQTGTFVDGGDSYMALSNGSTFITGWTVSSSSGDIVLGKGPTGDGYNAANGTYFVDLSGFGDSSPDGALSQTLSTVGGKTYTFSMDLYSGNTGTVSAIVGGVTLVLTAGTSFTVGTTTWTPETATFMGNPLDNTPLLTIMDKSPGSQIDFVDNISIFGPVTATPLPSTWTMLIAGFLGLGFFAYRGSKKNGAALSAA